MLRATTCLPTAQCGGMSIAQLQYAAGTAYKRWADLQGSRRFTPPKLQGCTEPPICQRVRCQLEREFYLIDGQCCNE